MAATVDTLAFGRRFVSALPGDPSASPWPREVRGAAWSAVKPTKVADPSLVAWSPEVAELLGVVRPAVRNPAVDVLGGNLVPAGMQPFAACYGGHQFGNWAGQLGDGRAIGLGDVEGPGGRLELQLKGAGPTPYSRHADGRAVLRSSIREFLCSEAMFHLGVPTTRALSLVGTGEPVVRDMFYDGHPRQEPGAIVCRVAPTFVRFGNFELPASRKELDLLGQLTALVITDHYPHLGPYAPDTVADFFREVVDRTAKLVAHWMALGFVHGVMNTDNLSILGVTIDYGPYGWLDVFDPDFTPNTTDAGMGRYRWSHQPAVAHWNLAWLGRSLAHLVTDTGPLQAALSSFEGAYASAWTGRLSDKLGFDLTPGDEPLITELFATLQEVETDWTLFFRHLADVPRDGDRIAPLTEAFYAPLPEAARQRLGAWLAIWVLRSGGVDPEARRARMNAANPAILPRNWVVHEAIEAAEAGDPSRVEWLLEAFRKPYEARAEFASIAGRRPEWAREKAGCSALSCSS